MNNIRHDKDGRGRTNEDITKHILHGLTQANPDIDVFIKSDDAIEMADKNAFLAVFSDEVERSIEFLSHQAKATKRKHPQKITYGYN